MFVHPVPGDGDGASSGEIRGREGRPNRGPTEAHLAPVEPWVFTRLRRSIPEIPAKTCEERRSPAKASADEESGKNTGKSGLFSVRSLRSGGQEVASSNLVTPTL